MSVITIDCSSNMFVELAPPCSYSRQEDIFDEDNRDREYREQEGDTSRWEINGEKYLELYLVRGWFDTFESVLDERHPNIKIKLTRRGSWSPKQYNFETDSAIFNLDIKEEDLATIREHVEKYSDVFDDYLNKYHASRSGFISFGPQDYKEWKRFIEYDQSSSEWTRAAIYMIDFWLFAFQEYIVDYGYLRHRDNNPEVPTLAHYKYNADSRFRDAYDRALEDLSGNGAIQECFEPVKEEEQEDD